MSGEEDVKKSIGYHCIDLLNNKKNYFSNENLHNIFNWVKEFYAFLGDNDGIATEYIDVRVINLLHEQVCSIPEDHNELYITSLAIICELISPTTHLQKKKLNILTSIERWEKEIQNATDDIKGDIATLLA